MPASEITHTISRVTFPAYSKLQGKPLRLRNAYLRTLQVVAFASIPMAGGIAFLASDFTRLFLGEKWMPMVPAMQVLAAWGLIRSVGASSGPLFRGVGRPDLGPRVQLAQVVLLAALIYPLTVRYGILGTSLAVVLNALVVYPINAYLTIKTAGCEASEYSKLLGIPMLMTSIMLGVLFLVKLIAFEGIGFWAFFVLVAVGTGIYLGLAFLAEQAFNYRPIREVLGVVARSGRQQ